MRVDSHAATPNYQHLSNQVFEERITEDEYDEVVEYAREVGLERLYLDPSMLRNHGSGIADLF